MATEVAPQLELVRAASQRLFDRVAGLTDEQARQPSALPGWSRGHLLTHLARNADGMINLLNWARTGVETPMYREPDGRDTDIEAGSGRPAGELVADLRAAAGRWYAVAESMPAEAWSAMVRRRPHTEPESAAALIDGRLFEVEFHHVDLGLGYRFDDAPASTVSLALAETHRRLTPGEPFAALPDDAADRLVFAATGTPVDSSSLVEVGGSSAELLGWLTGRADGSALRVSGGALPELPAW